jgi:anti-anti-sigma factor
MRIEFVDDTMNVHASPHFAGPAVGSMVEQVLESLENNKIIRCIFDFKETDLIDSSGIGFLVTLAKEFRNKNAQLILKNLDKDIFQLFHDTGLDRVFCIEKNGSVKEADLDLFQDSAVDIRLVIKKESIGDVGLFVMSGVLNHPLGSSLFKQQLLLFLAQHKNILLDFEELTFFDSLSISAILNMNNLLKSTGGSLKICAPNFIVKDLLLTLSIDLIIPVFDQREDALDDWRKINA